jgi:hypothetical protein
MRERCDLNTGRTGRPLNLARLPPPQRRSEVKKRRTAPLRQRSLSVKPYGKTYAASAMRLFLTGCAAGIFFFNQTFALHRPKNGATATIPKATAKAIRINISFSTSEAFRNPPRGEPGSTVHFSVVPTCAKVCNVVWFLQYQAPVPASIYHLRVIARTCRLWAYPPYG